MEENNHTREEQEPSSFKFSVDDEIPEFIHQTKRRSKALEKKVSGSEKKVSNGRLLAFLLFLLTGAILFVLYLDLRERVDNTYQTKAAAVETLSKELERKISSLSARYEKIDKALIEKISPMDEILINLEGTLSSLKEGMKKAEKNIEKFGEFHVEKKELANKVEQIEKHLDPVHENLKTVESAVKSLDEKFKKELAELSEALKQAKEDVANLVSKETDESPDNGQDNETEAESSANWIEKEAFELALENQQRLYQNKIDLLIENLATKEEKIQALGTKLQELEKHIKSFEKKPAAPEEAKAPKPEPAKEKPANESVIHPIDQIKPKPGTFVEQDIQ